MFRCTFWLMPYPRRQRGNKTHCNIKEYKIIYLTKKDSAEGQESKLYSLLPSKKFVLLVKVTQNATKGSAEHCSYLWVSSTLVLLPSFFSCYLKNNKVFCLRNAAAISEVKLLLVSNSYLYFCRSSIRRKKQRKLCAIKCRTFISVFTVQPQNLFSIKKSFLNEQPQK